MASPKIVIVEDNESDVALLRLALDQQGEDYVLEVLRDGQAALQFIGQQRLSPDANQPCVILIDLHLPKYDGLDVFREMRRDPVLSNVHLILLSSVASPKQLAEMRAMGADYRTKPTNVDELFALAADIFLICKGLAPATV